MTPEIWKPWTETNCIFLSLCCRTALRTVLRTFFWLPLPKPHCIKLNEPTPKLSDPHTLKPGSNRPAASRPLKQSRGWSKPRCISMWVRSPARPSQSEILEFTESWHEGNISLWQSRTSASLLPKVCQLLLDNTTVVQIWREIWCSSPRKMFSFSCSFLTSAWISQRLVGLAAKLVTLFHAGQWVQHRL